MFKLAACFSFMPSWGEFEVPINLIFPVITGCTSAFEYLKTIRKIFYWLYNICWSTLVVVGLFLFLQPLFEYLVSDCHWYCVDVLSKKDLILPFPLYPPLVSIFHPTCLDRLQHSGHGLVPISFNLSVLVGVGQASIPDLCCKSSFIMLVLSYVVISHRLMVYSLIFI